LDLIVKFLLVRHFSILEVLDDIQLVLLQNVVVRVKLFVFLLEAGSFELRILPNPVVYLELLGHMLKFLLLRNPDMLRILQLNSQMVDCLLQGEHAQRGLSCIFVFGMFRLLHGPHVLIHVPLV
jgi:hypothetical protein